MDNSSRQVVRLAPESPDGSTTYPPHPEPNPITTRSIVESGVGGGGEEPRDLLGHARRQGGEEPLAVLFATANSQEQGKAIAKGLLEQKLVACVNLLPHVTSLYEWEGKLEEAQEVLLVIKVKGTDGGGAESADTMSPMRFQSLPPRVYE